MALNSDISGEKYSEYLLKRLRKPLEGRGMQRSVGLTRIVGTHGTKTQSIVDLANRGEFTGAIEDQHIHGSFHITPNLLFSGWEKTGFSEDIARVLGQIGLVNPLEVSKEYAECGGEEGNGAVIAFDRKVLPLVRTVDVDEVNNEPEAVLESAPPIKSIRAIYPVDEAAGRILMQNLEETR